ncbi:hypothetical protein HMPREF9123_2528, partial [Neisseria bacilliformis ATCC BAA-1200]
QPPRPPPKWCRSKPAATDGRANGQRQPFFRRPAAVLPRVCRHPACRRFGFSSKKAPPQS